MASTLYLPDDDVPDVLPTTTSTAIKEKMHRQGSSPLWTVKVTLPIPGVATPGLRILVPNTGRLPSPFRRRWGPLVLCICVISITVFSLTTRRLYGAEEQTVRWAEPPPSPPPPRIDPSTLVFEREDLQRIWQWEIASGHYPSARSIPSEIGLSSAPINPAVPPRRAPAIPSRFKPPPGPVLTNALGAGPRRDYLDIRSRPPNVAYPPRPVRGSVADLDIIMSHCDYSQQKYVRDCLEVLRVGGGLEHGAPLRRGKADEWKYIFREGEVSNATESLPYHMGTEALAVGPTNQDPNAGLTKKHGVEWEPHLSLPEPRHNRPLDPCDDTENPRLFHMFWNGPFTDKPYLALLSYLYTQNTGINLPPSESASLECRPQFWMWINPGPGATSSRDMFDQLSTSPWASPFLHPRFHDVIKFKLWNTTEQLDGITELKDEWRALQGNLFNSGGVIHTVAPQEQGKDGNGSDAQNEAADDRLSMIISDMARFVVCHRFGGVYLDADTLFLRDWEELWGWKGAFAYRWSYHESYNTAVLRMTKGSALGTFLFRTALKNGLDFHPMTVSRYTKDAHLEGLLLRLPDALFDSAWLNAEGLQQDRPPEPFFYSFPEFFETPAQKGATPQALGFDGFFKGAYSYHFHNSWWKKPFDPARNWADLGPRFVEGERLGRVAAGMDGDADEWEDRVADDKQDLDWATVLKRTFEAYVRGDAPNMYGEWIHW